MGLTVNLQMAKKSTVNRQKRNILTVNRQMSEPKLAVKFLFSFSFLNKCFKFVRIDRQPSNDLKFNRQPSKGPLSPH